jgi:hypothetical protein
LRKADIGEKTVIEPQEGIKLPSSKVPLHRPLKRAVAEVDQFGPCIPDYHGLSANQSQHMHLPMRNLYAPDLVIRKKVRDRQIR